MCIAVLKRSNLLKAHPGEMSWPRQSFGIGIQPFIYGQKAGASHGPRTYFLCRTVIRRPCRRRGWQPISTRWIARGPWVLPICTSGSLMRPFRIWRRGQSLVGISGLNTPNPKPTNLRGWIAKQPSIWHRRGRREVVCGDQASSNAQGGSEWLLNQQLALVGILPFCQNRVHLAAKSGGASSNLRDFSESSFQ
jgi:hypothetical protein